MNYPGGRTNRIASGAGGEAESASSGPSSMISILMPVYNTPPDILDEAIRSVLLQTYSFWELCICDDCSTVANTSDVLMEYWGTDPRIKIVRTPKNMHIAGATNYVAQYAAGDFVAFLDHDDALRPDALAKVAEAIARFPNADVFYTDEDKLEEDGSHTEPYLKPAWSPEHLRSVMYILHFFTLRKSLFLELGGLREEYSGAQDYDLALRATNGREVVHVPGVLYHWRKIPGSAAAEVDAKPEALVRAEAALRDFAYSIDRNAMITGGLHPGTFRVMWHVDPTRPVTLLLTTNGGVREVEGRGKLRLLDNAVRSIVEKSSFRNFKLLVVDNGNLDSAAQNLVNDANGRVVSFSSKERFNFAEKMNFAVSHVDTEDVILLNDDIEVISEGWIEALLGFSRQADIGAVGARLLYPNGRVQHQGVVLGVCGLTSHIFHNMRDEDVGYNVFTHIVRNYSAVTGAVLATRLGLLRQLGGFDANLRVDYNDIDYCLRLGQLGLRIVYTPFAKLYHFEGSSLARKFVDPADEAVFLERWRSIIDRDPFFNPFLARDRLDCSPTVQAYNRPA
ncbi:MAG: hypothetical protein QOF41_2251 [Methylobacteriaceae bacterium]|nr:hypothetical protein [Methylobacteriaceae bacterium]